MIDCNIPAPLRPEGMNVAVSRIPWSQPKHHTPFHGHPSRFERLAAAVEELHRWSASLEILLASAALGSWGGREVLWPLWVDEAMRRTYCMIDLAVRLERQMTQRGNRASWSETCLGKATALAGSFAELRIVDDQEVVPCSGLLGEIAVGLLHLFKLPDGRLEARMVLEEIAMAAYKRRALILATSALVMQAIINAMDGGCAPAIGIKLADQGSGQWRLAVTEDDVCADNDARECDDIVDGLANLLAAENVRRLRRRSEFVTEIDFPGPDVGRSVLPKTSQVRQAVAWAQV